MNSYAGCIVAGAVTLPLAIAILLAAELSDNPASWLSLIDRYGLAVVGLLGSIWLLWKFIDREWRRSDKATQREETIRVEYQQLLERVIHAIEASTEALKCHTEKRGRTPQS